MGPEITPLEDEDEQAIKKFNNYGVNNISRENYINEIKI
jgi:hypothetical protein